MLQAPNGYEETKISFNLTKVNLLGFVFAIIVGIIFFVPFMFIWKVNLYLSINRIYLFIYFLIMILLHEVIHAIFFAGFSKNKFKSVKIGIMPYTKYFTPYCHCRELLKIRHYIISAVMPMTILGLVPIMISFFIGNFTLLFLGYLGFITGFGDYLFFIKLIKEKKDDLVFDLPNDAGFIIYRKKDDV